VLKATTELHCKHNPHFHNQCGDCIFSITEKQIKKTPADQAIVRTPTTWTLREESDQEKQAPNQATAQGASMVFKGPLNQSKNTQGLTMFICTTVQPTGPCLDQCSRWHFTNSQYITDTTAFPLWQTRQETHRPHFACGNIKQQDRTTWSHKKHGAETQQHPHFWHHYCVF